MSDLLVHYPAWHAQAACLGVKDPDIFFPESTQGPEAARAREICKSCPVARVCFGTAIQQGERWGIRGGHTPRQRKAILDDLTGMPKAPTYRGNINRTHCRNRHEFTPENSRWTTGGVLVCKTCAKASADRQTAKRRAAREAKAAS